MISPSTPLPNFLIVGAARSGTTSLYHWLRQHPEVFMPVHKEPCYFVKDFGLKSWDDYLALFERGAGKKAIGEASVQYLDCPESPSWIRDTLGDVKIIILLRNPIHRALSLYSLGIMDGSEWLPTFEDAILQEESRICSDSFRRQKHPTYYRHYMYVRGGLYYEQVKRYLDIFGKASVRVYLYDDLATSPAPLYEDVCSFLHVTKDVKPIFGRQNASKAPRFVRLQYLLHKSHALASRLPFGSASVVRGMTQPVLDWNVRIGSHLALSNGLTKQLREVYTADVSRLGNLIGKDLSHWLSPVSS